MNEKYVSCKSTCNNNANWCVITDFDVSFHTFYLSLWIANNSLLLLTLINCCFKCMWQCGSSLEKMLEVLIIKKRFNLWMCSRWRTVEGVSWRELLIDHISSSHSPPLPICYLCFFFSFHVNHSERTCTRSDVQVEWMRKETICDKNCRGGMRQRNQLIIYCFHNQAQLWRESNASFSFKEQF